MSINVKKSVIHYPGDYVYKLAQNQTDINGNFELQGGFDRLTKMNVKLKVYHNCNNDIRVGGTWQAN
jgi:hypothetical protein